MCRAKLSKLYLSTPSLPLFTKVNTSNENSRAVIRTAVRTVQDLHKEVAVLKEKLQAAEDATTRLYEKAATMKVSKKKSKGVTRSHSILSIASGSQDGHSLDALDPLLESFVTLADAAGPAAVKCRAGFGGMEVLQAAIGKDYTNKKAAAALRGEVQSEENIIPRPAIFPPERGADGVLPPSCNRVRGNPICLC